MPPRRPRASRNTLADGRVVMVRQVTKDDVAEIIQFFDRLSDDARYTRFMHHKTVLRVDEVEQGLSDKQGAWFGLVATVPAPDGIDIVGGAQFVPDGKADGQSCEFAITVADDWHGSGLGWRLLSRLVRRASRAGYATIHSSVLAQNRAMLALAHRLHFTTSHHPEDPGVVIVSRSLVKATRSAR